MDDPPEDRKMIGARIRRAREQRRLSRDTLAAQSGVSVTVQRRIEGGVKAGRRSIADLEQALGIGEQEQPPITPDDHLRHVTDDGLFAELQRRWHDRNAELLRLRARTGPPLGVTAPVPEHLTRGPVARNAGAEQATPTPDPPTAGTPDR